MAVFLSDHHHHHHRGKERRVEGLRREKSWDRAGGMSWQNAARHGMCMVLAFDIGMVWYGTGTGHGHGAVRHGMVRQGKGTNQGVQGVFVRCLLGTCCYRAFLLSLSVRSSRVFASGFSFLFSSFPSFFFPKRVLFLLLLFSSLYYSSSFSSWSVLSTAVSRVS